MIALERKPHPELLTPETKSVGMFPGQGSQSVGMGMELYNSFYCAREVYRQADEILGYSITDIITNNPDNKLFTSDYGPPAILTCSYAYWRVIEQCAPEILPDLVVGHSVGEISALVAAGTVSFEDGLKIVEARSQFVKEEGNKLPQPGTMAYISGVTQAEVEKVIDRKTVFIANKNLPTQFVVTGYRGGVQRVVDSVNNIREQSKRRVRAGLLNITDAYHSPLMIGAQERFAEFLADRTFSLSRTIPILMNGPRRNIQTADDVRFNLSEQIVRGVDWVSTIHDLRADGVNKFVEFGNGDVLTKIVCNLLKDDEEAEKIEVFSLDKL